MLAGGDGDVCGFGDLGQALDVVGEDGFFEPCDIVVLELAGHPDGLLGIVAVVGIDEDFDIVANRFAYGFETLDIGAFVVAEIHADLHLYAGETHVDISGLFGDQFVNGVVRPTAAAVARYGVVSLSEEFVQRDAQGFAFEVPECDVEAGDGLECEAFATKTTHSPEHFSPDAFGFERGFANQDIFQVVIDQRPDSRRRVEVAETLRAFIGVDVDEDGGPALQCRAWEGGSLNLGQPRRRGCG